MRAPDYVRDGWWLEDGEERNRAAPATFHIPALSSRKQLGPGDLAQLIFKIAVEGDEHESVERMWVIVRERIPGGYLGMLDNEPASIDENDEFWCGTELPFEYRHIISIKLGNETTLATARAPVPIPWDRAG